MNIHEQIARLIYKAVSDHNDGYAEPVGDDESLEGLTVIDGGIDFMAVADVLVRELAPDIDKVAQEIWQTYIVEVGRSLPEGMADRLARAAAAAMGWEPTE